MPDKDEEQTLWALKYPEWHTWRDLDAALARGGRWPDGEIVRISDPEMKPRMDAISEKINSDPKYARSLANHVIQDLPLTQPLLPKYIYDKKQN